MFQDQVQPLKPSLVERLNPPVYWLSGDVTRQHADVYSRTYPKTILINSDGGDVAAALAIYDALSGRDIDTVATGACQSAATIVLQAGQVRYATPHTYFRVHPVEGSYRKSMVDNIIHWIYSKKMDCASIIEAYDLETFDAITAQRLGLIDKILE